ncbi:MAG: TauD/TfdA family dioxygenase [Candidatus Latescibacteria bacterium]|nr:TauD/TfdA family dioxygenase [Candidatus Latescibacterota bacterium]
MALKIRARTDVLGAEISGLDFSRGLDAQDVVVLRDAFLQYHLLCLRSEPLTPKAFVALSRYFGEPKCHVLRRRRHDEVPEVAVMDSTYQHAEDKPVDFRLDRKSAWHTDDSYFEKPAKVTLLQGLKIPDSGGQTRFCNTQKAFEDLSETEKHRVDGLQVVHAYDTVRAPARAAKRTPEEEAETPDVIHPLIRTHEDTGTKAFYFNPNRTDRVVDMERTKSDALLDWVDEMVTQSKYRYDHEWRVGDILIWDNRSVLHSVNMDFPVGQRRLHHRILLEGERPR